jgi:micrococcal nuclease
MFTYYAQILDVYDGDTATAMVDLGFTVSVKVKLRFYGINTPELRTKDPVEKKAGYVARDFVRERILGNTVRVQTHKKGKYGRWIATIWEIVDGEAAETSINDKLLQAGLASPYMKD